MSVIPRDLVAKVLGVSPDALPPGDLPVARLIERWFGFTRATLDSEAPQDHPEFWTFVLINDLVAEMPALALDAVLAAVTQAADADELALVAGGPLQDLLERQGDQVIAGLEDAAKTSARLRLALGAVQPEGSAGAPSWRRVAAAAGDAALLESGTALPQS